MNKGSEFTIFWSWNGDMSLPEVREQLLGFHKRGVTGVFIHARAGLKLKYLEEEWFYTIEEAVNLAEQIGMDIYLYDEDGWPSGFAGGRVAEVSKSFWSMPVDIKTSVCEDEIVLFSYRKEDSEYILDLNGGDLFVVGRKNKYYVDLLNPECVDTFIKLTHEKYKERFSKHFGKTIRGIFTDEPQLMQPYVYNRFIKEEYFARFNENIEEKFYLLNLTSIEAKEFQLRYFEVVAKLFNQNFTKKIAKWCEENNMLMTGHFAGEDGLCSYRFNYGVMTHYISMQQPGIDFLGKRVTSPVLMKQISSIKNQFNKEKVLCEVFGGAGWNINFETLRYIWAYNACFNVNLPCAHIGAYSIEGIRKRDYPAFFSHQEPWFDEFGSLIKTCKTLSDFASKGKSYNDALIISPLLSLACLPSYSDRAKVISTEYRHLVDNLLDLQVRFDVTDESILKEYATVEEEKLCLKDCKYSFIFVADEDVISLSTYNVLKLAEASGIQITFINNYPSYIYNEEIGVLVPFEVNTFKGCHLINNRDKIINKYLKHVSYKRSLEVRGGFSNELVKDLLISEKIVNNCSEYLILNTSEVDQKEFKLALPYDSIKVCYDLENEETITYYSASKIFNLTLKPCEAIIVSPSELTDINNNEVKSISYLKANKVSINEPNILTIDTARYRLDNNDYNEVMPVIDIQDEVFSVKADTIYVDYQFELETKLKDLYLAIEDIDIKELYINNILLTKKDGYFIDKCINKYPLNGYLVKGINHITSVYQRNNEKIMDVEAIFETERNRFSYPIVIENIYIVGDFSVKTNCIPEDDFNYYRLFNPKFVLTKSYLLNPKDELSKQGLYFYRGKVDYEYTLLHKGENVSISLTEKEGVLVSLYINNQFIKNIFSNEEVFIKEYLVEGENSIIYRLFCSNRNTLGPHHHKDGETLMTGVHTFKGVRGFEDDFSSFYDPNRTWVDCYNFVNFYLGDIKVTTYKKENEKGDSYEN